MALDREVNIPDEVLDLAMGRFVRPDQVARVRDYLDSGGTYRPEAVAARILEEIAASSRS